MATQCVQSMMKEGLPSSGEPRTSLSWLSLESEHYSLGVERRP